MKKGLLLIAMSAVLLTTGCGWMSCNKDAKGTEKAAAKTTEKAAEKKVSE